MAAPITCGFCNCIPTQKAYRRLPLCDFGAAFSKAGLMPIDIACCNCFNKMNRLRNAENELQRKMDQFQSSQEQLVSTIRGLPGVKRATGTPGKYIVLVNFIVK